MVICLVGLPGRGKSFIARKLQSFLTWRGNECEVFNVGKYRRQAQADFKAQHANDNQGDVNGTSIRNEIGACDANFFDSKNPHAAQIRHEAASLALKDMLDWLDVEEESPEALKIPDHLIGSKAIIPISRIAIFDATNSTKQRRQWVLEECTDPKKRGGKVTGCVFVESVCDDEELLDENFRFKVRNSPDFKGMTEDEAIVDLKNRCKKYEEQYETVDDDSQSYIKVFNLSSKLLVNHIYGRMAKVIVPSLMSWNIGSRAVYLCRSGNTTKLGTDGGYSPKPTKPRKISRGEKLGPSGDVFRVCLGKFVEKEGRDFLDRKDSAMAFAPLNRNTGTSITGIAIPPNIFNSLLEPTDPPFGCHVMTSTMPRAVQTATWPELNLPIEELPNLNPLDKGDFTGMELNEIKENHPEWYAMLEKDPFLTRYERKESSFVRSESFVHA